MCWGDWAELPQHFPGGLFLGHFCLDRFLPVHELWGKRNLTKILYYCLWFLWQIELPSCYFASLLSSLLGDLTAISAWIPAFMYLISSFCCLWGGLCIHDPGIWGLDACAAVWRALHMAWSDWDLSRCVEDHRSLGFPDRSSIGNNKLGLGLPGSCFYAGQPGSRHTPRICRVLTVRMSWVAQMQRLLRSVTQISSLQYSPATIQGRDSSYQAILLQVWLHRQCRA